MADEITLTCVGGLSALGGSIVGGLVSLLYLRFLTKQDWHLGHLERERVERMTLYGDLLAELGRLYMLAFQKTQPMDAREFTISTAMLARIHLVASAPVIEAAENLADHCTAFCHDREAGTGKTRTLTQRFINEARAEFTDLRRRRA